MSLLVQYGMEGLRLRDPGVVAMLEDGTPPERYAKPIKRLLHLLRDVDRKWLDDHQLV